MAQQCQKRLRALEQQETPPSGEAQPSVGGNAVREADMCLQLLHVPACRGAVSQAISRALSHGVLTKDEVSALPYHPLPPEPALRSLHTFSCGQRKCGFPMCSTLLM